jgi:maltose alpha-D-glucosyltransferase / alpha-amylase
VPTLHDLLNGPHLDLLHQQLPAYLLRQRWFGSKSRTIQQAQVLDWAELPGLDAALLLVQIHYEDDSIETYQLPVAIRSALQTDQLHTTDPTSIIATFPSPTGEMLLHDGAQSEDLRQALLTLIADNASLPTHSGIVTGSRSSALSKARGTDILPARTGSAEQSNTSILYGGRLIMKLFRRLQPGENPDTEIGRFLTETAHFPRIAPFLGDIRWQPQDKAGNNSVTTLAMLQALVENEGDGWQWTLDELARFYALCIDQPGPSDDIAAPNFLTTTKIPQQVRDIAAVSLDAASLLGQRTAELHLALATTTRNPAFAAESFSPADLASDDARINTQVARTLDTLQHGVTQLSDAATIEGAHAILASRADLLQRAHLLTSADPTQTGQRIRIHGDYHLGQVLRAEGDYVILDFEGEPARPLAERRQKQSPLKDVAGMLRSFSYAAYAGLNQFLQDHPADPQKTLHLETWARQWENAAAAEFLLAYKLAIAGNPQLIPQPQQAQLLLNAYLLEKALYELLYELNNRPTWVRIPIAGILSLPQ